MMQFEELRAAVVQWAEDRMIIPRSSTQAQLLKTVEELGELIGAVLKNQRGKISDGFGDVVVTLIIAAELSGLDLTMCLSYAYDEIKGRTGTLGQDGVFVKDE